MTNARKIAKHSPHEAKNTPKLICLHLQPSPADKSYLRGNLRSSDNGEQQWRPNHPRDDEIFREIGNFLQARFSIILETSILPTFPRRICNVRHTHIFAKSGTMQFLKFADHVLFAELWQLSLSRRKLLKTTLGSSFLNTS